MPKIPCKPFDNGLYKYAHVKRDGNWLHIVKSVQGRISCLSSTDRDITDKLQNQGWMLSVAERVPVGTELYGELYAPGHPASEVSSLMADGDPLSFEVFAIPTEAAHTPLEDLHRLCILWGLEFVPYSLYNGDFDMTWEQTQLQFPDVEGFVFKDANTLNWAKWKPVKTIDVIIAGFNEGSGHNVGLIGSMICTLADGTEVGNAGGMNQHMRNLMTLNEEDYIGKVVEVAYQYVGRGNRLRHPRFKRMRPDKPAHLCTADQDPDLRSNK